LQMVPAGPNKWPLRKRKGALVQLDKMKITLRKDPDPQTDLYYRRQFEIYREPCFIWDHDTWKSVLTSSDVYQIEVSGKYAGDVILEDRGKGRKYIADFGLLPGFQGKGIGKAVLKEVKKMGKRLSAFTRKETLPFYLKSGFVLKRTMRNYFSPGVDRYYVECELPHRGSDDSYLDNHGAV
jgi:GNAT superfamily N-acetyltransferase